MNNDLLPIYEVDAAKNGILKRQPPDAFDVPDSLIDGIEDGFPSWISSGLVRMNALQRRLDAWAPFHGYQPRSDWEQQDALAFWSSGAGDYVLADCDRAVSFDHENSNLKDEGPLRKYLDRFFRDLIV